MATVKWLPQAQRELRAIHDFLARVSPDYGALVSARIVTATLRLEVFPRSGRIVPEIGLDDVREVFYRTYRIVYVVVSDERVDVLTVLPSSRPLGTPGV